MLKTVFYAYGALCYAYASVILFERIVSWDNKPDIEPSVMTIL